MKNRNLHKAKSGKNDEFYTQLTDIEKELRHYKEHFKDKVVFCNCDDPEWSNFWHFFSLNFEHFGLKKLISTHYDAEKPTYKMERTGMDDADVKTTPLRCNGDFRSDESVSILMEADIVVTNPPFSLFREYISQLMTYEKKFLVMGNINAVTYKEIFPLIKDKKLWIGLSIRSGDREFNVPDDYPLQAANYRVDKQGNKYIRVKGVRWFTNMDYKERHNQPIELYRTYHGHEQDYPKYDNYDAIEVSKVKDIPYDYRGVMGVPITFLDKYNPEQFEILGGTANGQVSNHLKKDGFRVYNNPISDGRKIYQRILISIK